jgi:hypothetical protein
MIKKILVDNFGPSLKQLIVYFLKYKIKNPLKFKNSLKKYKKAQLGGRI